MMRGVRTTITLDADAAALVKRAMRERGLTFKEAVNEAIRRGLGGDTRRATPSTPAFEMGEPLVDLDKALRLAGSMEDVEAARRLQRRS